MNHIMVDLETLGTRPGCAILSIGAIAFNYPTQSLGPEFYIVVNQGSCQDAGLHVDKGTLAWWGRQSDQARTVLQQSRKGGASLSDALTALNEYIRAFPSEVRIWGNGASFDNAILACCYAAVNMRIPWKFVNDRCYRTLKNMVQDIPMERTGTYHNALDDAKSQAIHAMKIMERLSRVSKQ